MKVLYGQPLTEDERKHFTQIVYTNVIMIIKTLANQVDKYGLKEEVSFCAILTANILVCFDV